jgi:diguanylate cyclase (GGDEF)-like protein
MRRAESRERALANALIHSAALLSSSLDLDDVLDKILELASQVVAHESANIMLIDGEDVHVVRSRGYKNPELYDYITAFITRVEDFSTIVHLIQSGKPLIIPDTRKYPGWHTSPEFSWLRSYLGAPLLVKGKVIGVINLDSGIAGFFSEDDTKRFQAFADLAATAISNANLYKALQEQAEESKSLFRAATALLSSSTDLGNLAKQITQTVHQDFSTAHVAILMIDETSNKLVQVAQAGYALDSDHPLTLNGKLGLAAAAIRSKKPVYAPDVNQDPRYIKDSLDTRSEFDIPFMVDNNVIGVLNLESREIDGFPESARRVILTYAKRAAIALENARLIERLQKREFQITLINRLTQISLQTGNLEEMLVNQVNILFETLSPDGVIVSFTHEILRKIISGYAVTSNERITQNLNKMILDPSLAHKLENLTDVVVTDDDLHVSLPDSKNHNPFKAFIVHTLSADGIHLGSAVLGYFNPRIFDKSEVKFFEQVIDQVALAVAKNLSIINANQRAKEAENLREATSTLTSTLNLQEVFERILQTAVDAIPSSQNGLLFLYDSQKQVYNVRAQFGFTDSSVFTIRIGAYEGLAGKVVNDKKAQIFNNVSVDDFSNSARQKHEIVRQKSWIVAPLIQQNTVYGVIELCATNANVFLESDLHVLISFADTVTAAIHNAQLHTEVQQIAITDILTGLYNRRGFEELGLREIHRALRTSAPLSMLLLDVDYLKKINDEHGHSAGDRVLQEIADCCRKTFRQIDLVSRHGGDEFAILLPDTQIDHAREAAERLRKTIETRTVQIGQTKLKISASIGVASFDKKMQTISELFELADKALYLAKNGGRNMIFCWDDQKPDTKQ